MIPTSTSVSVKVGNTLPAKAEVYIAFVAEGGKLLEASLPEGVVAAAGRLLKGKLIEGKAKEASLQMIELGKQQCRLLLMGVGSLEALTAQALREAGATAARTLKRAKLSEVAVGVAPLGDLDAAAVAEAFVTGYRLASFDFREFKGTGSEQEKAVAVKITCAPAAGGDVKGVRAAAERAVALTDAQNFARTISQRPANDINPVSLAKVAQAMAKGLKLKCRVMDEKEMKRLGMGGILAVGGGSATPPRLIVLEHKPAGVKKGQKPLLVVGKSITFDTGGYSIKPAASMPPMIFDKCGGTFTLGFMAAVASLKLKRHVVGILAAAENMISHTAYRPGDILKMYNGVTVDVTNTDAEGRLVLADALAWGCEAYKPQAVVDLATLTGAAVVAVGLERAAVFSNDDALFAAIDAASKREGEKLWRLPMGEEYREQLKAQSADIVNSPGRWGGACTAASFLGYFVPEGTPWLHIDLCPADAERDLPLYAKGATGFAVRTLVAWASQE